MTETETLETLEAMPIQDRARFLCILGHALTIQARLFAPQNKVSKKSYSALIHLEEIHHRLYQVIEQLFVYEDQDAYPLPTFVGWLVNEDYSDEVQASIASAFKLALMRLPPQDASLQ